MNEGKIIFVFLYIYSALHIQYIGNINWKIKVNQTVENYKA